MVRQNYTCDVNCLLVKQIHWELRASYLYQAYASYFQRADVSLPGIQKFFAHASLEERSHADYFIDYVNKRGGHVHLGQFDVQNTCETVMVFLQSDNSRLDTEVEERMCICGFVSPGGRNKINKKCPLSRETWMEGLMALEDALAAERFVNGKLLELHKRADKLNDAHVAKSRSHCLPTIQHLVVSCLLSNLPT
ncbi:hypothetical protein RRG08_017922 [Elysia crispata]|uniref:Ferritin n=1 Tax=Elysia crispata TaxID=231223 RepID=A0AAE0XZ25_9GAST|nr:hypothetical protein RRG08_017922 [Elysia crispata]